MKKGLEEKACEEQTEVCSDWRNLHQLLLPGQPKPPLLILVCEQRVWCSGISDSGAHELCLRPHPLC